MSEECLASIAFVVCGIICAIAWIWISKIPTDLDNYH